MLSGKSILIMKQAIETVRQSVMVSFPIAKQTEMMIATEATFTASRKVENRTELRIFFTNGFSKATKMKDGRKIPMVETIAPVKPLI